MLVAGYSDLFATKGLEYLLVIGFLGALVLFWRLLIGRGVAHEALSSARTATGWFRLPTSVFCHPGHGWAMPDGRDVVRVGIDDFAQRLVGAPRSLRLPRDGERLEPGEKGWSLDVDGQRVDILSPIGGEVVAVNDAVRRRPELINEDPYGEGWLLKVRVPRIRAALRNLLSGEVARAWMEQTESALRRRMATELGPLMQDGGVPVSGFARSLSPEGWKEVVDEFLLTGDSPPE